MNEIKQEGYEVLAKFFVPVYHVDELLRDSLSSGIQYAGVYLLRDTREDREEWYRENKNKPIGQFNLPCQYLIAYEDWGNVFLDGSMCFIKEDELDDRDYYHFYTDALLAFQYCVNELIMEMQTKHTIDWIESLPHHT